MSSIKTAHDEESSPKLDSSKRDSKDGPDRVYSLPVLNESEESDLAYAAALLSSGEDKEASDPKWITTRTELWSFYSYYVGNCGLSGFNYGPTQVQNLLSLAADAAGNGTCGGDTQPVCRLFWAGSNRTVQSIVLLANGISFAIQVVLFISIGSMADYGSWRPRILWTFTAAGVATGLAWLGYTDPSQWKSGIALYMVGLIAYQGSLTFWTAAFPSLARNLPEVRESAAGLASSPPRTTAAKHAEMDMIARNRVSNVAFTVQSVFELVILAVLQGILVALGANDSTENNTKALSVACAYTAGVWALCAMPWFIAEKHRPGQKLPPGTNYFTAGIQQATLAARYIWKLKQTLLYLVFYFLFSDAFNTSVTVISTVQYRLISFSSTTNNELLITGIAAQAVGIGLAWYIQKTFKYETLTCLKVNVFFIVLLQVWGLIGIYTDKFGFHNRWEAFAYQAYYGVFVCPWYAFSQTMISEVSPKGFEFLFFSFFTIAGKTSAFIGPFVTQAISDQTGNYSTPFYFLLALSLVSCVLLIPMDTKKSKLEQAVFLKEEVTRKKVENETNLKVVAKAQVEGIRNRGEVERSSEE